MTSSWSPLLLLLGSVLVLGPEEAEVQQEDTKPKKAAIGELVPEHTFREFLACGDGRQELSDFRGQPVLIVNWTNTDFGRGASKMAEKIAEEWVPKGLISVLRDTHQQTAEEIQAAVMKLYPGSLSRLTANQKFPIEYLDNGPPPDIALIAVDGKLLLAGSYTTDMGKVEKLLKADLKRQKSGWGEHDAARTSRALAYGKKRLAESMAVIEEALELEPALPELLEVRTEIATRHENWAGSVQYYLDCGQYRRAQEAANALADASKGNAEWESQAATLLQIFESAEAKHELELDKKLAALLKPLNKKRPSASNEKKLRKFAVMAAGTKVCDRALHLAEIVALASK